MKKIDVNFLEPSQQQLNDLIKYYQTKQYDNAEKLARMAVDETNMGSVEDKILKNKGKMKLELYLTLLSYVIYTPTIPTTLLKSLF